MALRDQQFTSFKALGTGTLRLEQETATRFANHLTSGCEGLHVIGQLCTAPQALQVDTLAIMLERFFRRLPEFAAARLILERKTGPAQAAPPLDAANVQRLHDRVVEVCIVRRGLTEAEARRAANFIRDGASAFFALEQKCRAADRHTQKLLCAILRTALGQPLEQAQQAAEIYLANGGP